MVKLSELVGLEATDDFVQEYDISVLRFSDNYTNFRVFKQLISDGSPLDLLFRVDEYNSPLFSLPSGKKFKLFLTPTMERYIINYLLTGKNRGIPSYPANGVVIDYKVDSDYIYKHIKREIERGTYTYKNEEKDNIEGIRFVANYPYGSIDYGFFPFSCEDLSSRIENIEAFPNPTDEQDIPDLDSHTLPIEYKYLKHEKANSIRYSMRFRPTQS